LKKRIEEEVEDTTKQNEEIAQRWSIVTALEVPQELAKQIEAQHQVFWSIVCRMCIFD
jgi:hypothetical protein